MIQNKEINSIIRERLGEYFYLAYISNSTESLGLKLLKEKINISDYANIIDNIPQVNKIILNNPQYEAFQKTSDQLINLSKKIQEYSDNIENLAREEFISQGKNIMHHILSLKDNRSKFKSLNLSEKETFLNDQLGIWTNAYKQNYFKSINENFNNFEDRMVSNVVYHTLIEYNEIIT